MIETEPPQEAPNTLEYSWSFQLNFFPSSMHNPPTKSVDSFKLRLLFWFTVITIPFISFTGRRLQYWVEGTIGKQETGWLIAFLLLLAASAYITQFINHWRRLWWRLLVIITLLLTIFEYVPVAEERIHFILFGLLGYLSISLFSLLTSILICISLSIGDEVFQWLLPDRVGDIRDVIFNLLASSIGSILAFSVRRDK